MVWNHLSWNYNKGSNFVAQLFKFETDTTTDSGILVYEEPRWKKPMEKSNWLDDSKSLLGKWLFHQTSMYKWLFVVPGGT